MIVKAHKHKETGQLFSLKKDYDAFCKRYQKKQEKARAEKAIEDNWDAMINEPRLKATSVDDFINRVVLLWQKVMGKKVLNYNLFVSFKEVSNSHSHPIGGIGNWGREKGKPTSYPGWEGRIKGKTEPTGCSLWNLLKPGSKSSFGCDIPGFRTGSGNGGSSFDMEVRFFLQDFPLIYESFKESLEKKEEVKKNLEDMREAQRIYMLHQNQYVSTIPEILKISSNITENNTQITKLQELNRYNNEALTSYRQEAIGDYVISHPHNFEQISLIETQLKWIEDQIKTKV